MKAGALFFSNRALSLRFFPSLRALAVSVPRPFSSNRLTTGDFANKQRCEHVAKLRSDADAIRCIFSSNKNPVFPGTDSVPWNFPKLKRKFDLSLSFILIPCFRVVCVCVCVRRLYFPVAAKIIFSGSSDCCGIVVEHPDRTNCERGKVKVSF